MSCTPPHLLIFTDLDGTLLDHYSYSATPADRLIRILRDQAMADIIPITSKTHSELKALQHILPIEDTITVTENGSVIFAPLGRPFLEEDHPHRMVAGIQYDKVLDQISELPEHLRQLIVGFNDMTVAEVANATGLAMADAQRAKDRDATEPFIWLGSDEAFHALQAIMVVADIQIQRGGRFYHFTGQASKEQAMKTIISAFTAQQPEANFISIALGDGPNDLGMIEAADIGIIMPNTDGVTITSSLPHVRSAAAPGPRGWTSAILEILPEVGLTLPEE
ncbi:HAD-IIB family hydrolase [Parasphingorhabdus sp.]|uniref:HAD-IIB family hydrolase n=1 Tax=Parasphingorhabdus sp. TaxID=2709688 RepID=UPI003BB19A2B